MTRNTLAAKLDDATETALGEIAKLAGLARSTVVATMVKTRIHGTDRLASRVSTAVAAYKRTHADE